MKIKRIMLIPFAVASIAGMVSCAVDSKEDDTQSVSSYVNKDTVSESSESSSNTDSSSASSGSVTASSASSSAKASDSSSSSSASSKASASSSAASSSKASSTAPSSTAASSTASKTSTPSSTATTTKTTTTTTTAKTTTTTTSTYSYDGKDISDISEGTGEVIEEGQVQVISCSGTSEAGYINYKPVTNATAYNIYIDGVKATENDAYTQTFSSYVRTDLFGLTATTHKIRVVPVITGVESTATATQVSIDVAAYDRSGYAHFNYTNGVGAYNDDGTLKDNAVVLYVTDKNKNTISLTVGDTTVTGIGNILNSAGQNNGTGTASNGGTCNSNNGIIKKLSEAGKPLVVRFVGTVSDSGLYKQGTNNAANTPLIDGLTLYDSTGNGGTEGDNGHMARMKSGKDVTLEGVGEDAVIDGWGFHFMAESATESLGYGKSFEVRNLTFINQPEDAIGMEGVQAATSASSYLTASVERCWIHNNEMYGPTISNPAESDKSEGDGSCDFKRGQYLTVSYNYFEGCHKTNLVGSADTSLQFNLTYHHNYWYMCKARGPLTRRANVHMYNNIFEGQTDYALNTRADAYIYSEYNLFLACKNPTRVDGGAIKSYNDSFSCYVDSCAATIVTDKSTTVSNSCAYSYYGIDYSKFDTDSSLSYIPAGNYNLQTSVTDARKYIYAYCGVQKSTQITPASVAMSDISLEDRFAESTSNTTIVGKVTVSDTSTVLAPGKLQKSAYEFTITSSMTATVSYSSGEAVTNTGALLNEAGELMLYGSGSVNLVPGKYFIVPFYIQAGDSAKLTQWTYKTCTCDSITFAAYSDADYNQKMIDAYNAAVAALPDEIDYSDSCYSSIKACMTAYANLGTSLQSSVDYTPVTKAYNTFKSLGQTYVVELIDEIGTVDANSGVAITAARSAYTTLMTRCSDATVSNYATLTAAEKAFESYAVTACINAINDIGTVTASSDSKITYAESLYAGLTDDQQAQVTNYSTLTAARAAYDSIVKVNNVIALINAASSTDVDSINAAITAYNALTATEQSQVTNYSKLESLMPAYVVYLIDQIGTVTSASGPKIVAAEEAYADLTATEQGQVTNYATLVAARAAYDAIANTGHELHYSSTSDSKSTDFFEVSGSLANKGPVTYNGTSYSVALKIESSTTIKFTTTEATTLTIVTDTASKNIKVNGIAVKTDANCIYTAEIAAGSYTITKGDVMNLFYMSVMPTGSSATTYYTVTFDANGGTPSTATQAVASGATVSSLPTATYTGYVFAGWYTAKSGGTEFTTSTTVSANTTVYAHWTEDTSVTKYTVTFDANGGTATATTATVASGATVSALPTATYTGYTFDGWYTAKSGGTEFTTSTTVTANTTVYAHWSEVTYTVTFSTAYGSAAALTNVKTITSLPTLTDDNYKLVGWYYDSACTSAASVGDTLTGDTTLYAKWEQKITSTSGESSTGDSDSWGNMFGGNN